MTQERLEKIATSLYTEVLTDKSYICLNGNNAEGEAQWGFSEDIEKIKEYFLYLNVIYTLMKYKEIKHKEVISENVFMSLFNDLTVNMEDCSLEERKFCELWYKTKNDTGYKALEKNSTKLCDYLKTLGFELSLTLFKNAKEALPTALKIDALEGYNDGMGFSSLLYAFVHDTID